MRFRADLLIEYENLSQGNAHYVVDDLIDKATMRQRCDNAYTTFSSLRNRFRPLCALGI